jgi:uncharacterized protein YgbK (DUF1537 family)
LAANQGAYLSVLPFNQKMPVGKDVAHAWEIWRNMDEQLVAQLLQESTTANHVMLSTHELVSEPTVETAGISRNGNESNGRLLTKQRLSLIALAVLRRSNRQALIVFGGDTAFGIWQLAGLPQLEPVGEILPGIPICRMRFCNRWIWLVSKAGGYGDRSTLTEIIRRLTGT